MYFFQKHKVLLLFALGFILVAVGSWFYNESLLKSGKKGFLPFVKKNSRGKVDFSFGKNGEEIKMKLVKDTELSVPEQAAFNEIIKTAEDSKMQGSLKSDTSAAR